ncbi:MAG: hypothetical protein M1834_002548 [Cirrosporium novae-zelandiae]|nr:MAG: hypothetical protein M1834_002548 [Cirrosporium novae-zelandiae]
MSTIVPTIDVSPFLHPSDFTDDDRKVILGPMRQACLDHGFFLITGHGVSRELQDRVFKQSRRFFDLPLEQKLELSEEKSWGKSHRGYQMIGGEGAQEGKGADVKENDPENLLTKITFIQQGFQMGVEKKINDPHVQRKRILTGPNIWPSALEPTFSTTMKEYFDTVCPISIEIMKILALTLDVDFETCFKPYCEDSLRAVRLLHYPPMKESEKGQLGTGAHTDFGALTLLLTDEIGGLQILDRGEWVDVVPNSDAYGFYCQIVNIGDMFTKMTSGLYKSSVHRVINTTDKHRYSMPCFLDGALDFVVKPIIDGPIPQQEKYTVEEHMTERFESVRNRGAIDEIRERKLEVTSFA